MSMTTLIICRGLPASGKTTWAQAKVGIALASANKLSHPTEKFVRVNRDDIRAMLHNSTFVPGLTEDVVIAARNEIIKAALRKGWSVISDDTNLKSRNVRDLLKIADKCGAEVKFQDFTDVTLNECIKRDASRSRSVGEDAIRDQYDRYIRGRSLPLPIPDLQESVKFAPIVAGGNLPAAIVDVDGTLAYNNGHRGWYEYEKVGADEPVENIVRLAQDLYFSLGNLFIVSGRKEECREITRRWLQEHVFSNTFRIQDGDSNDPPQMSYSSGIYLLMRKDGDNRDDSVVKYELYRDYIAPWYNVKVVLDDRDRVVRMWRQIGLTCLQVAEGDF